MFGFGTGTRGGRRAQRFVSCRVLHVKVGTILPSGPRPAIASFGSSEGHSLSVGPLGFVPRTKRNMDTHLRTCFASALGGDCPVGCPRNRGVAYASRSVSIDRRYCSGLYSSWFFHMRKTVAAMVRARVSLARLGLVPASSSRW